NRKSGSDLTIEHSGLAVVIRCLLRPSNELPRAMETLNRYIDGGRNAIRRRICVVSRIRDAEYGLVTRGNLAAAAPTAFTTRGLMHRSLLRRANVGYSEILREQAGGPRAAYDRFEVIT